MQVLEATETSNNTHLSPRIKGGTVFLAINNDITAAFLCPIEYDWDNLSASLTFQSSAAQSEVFYEYVKSCGPAPSIALPALLWDLNFFLHFYMKRKAGDPPFH